jgi:drug/metabolite transporter (DMT)-like permease
VKSDTENVANASNCIGNRMTTHIAMDRKANLFGSVFMIAAMALFALEDAFIKAASVMLPVGQILIVFGLGGAFVFACMARLNNEPLFVRDVLSRPMRIRVIFEITGRLFYVLAIALTPLSAATVILQATPLVVVAGAALAFGEKVGWRRWTAIFIGLIGVIVIIQPGTDSFSMLSVLAIVGMIGFAGRDLASRAAPATLSTSLLGFYGFLSVVVAGVAFAIWQGVPVVYPEIGIILRLLGAILAGVVAYSCLMKAMRTGEVAAVTPFRYTRLLFGIALGIVLFGEQLTPAMMLGSGLIVLSGLFILWRSGFAA